MSLPLKDVRLKLDAEMHAAMTILADAAGRDQAMKYRVLSGRYRDQIVSIVRRNGSAVQVATIGVPVAVFWTSKKNLEAVQG